MVIKVVFTDRDLGKSIQALSKPVWDLKKDYQASVLLVCESTIDLSSRHLRSSSKGKYVQVVYLFSPAMMMGIEGKSRQ